MFQCDQHSLQALRRYGLVSAADAVSTALMFLQASADNGRHIWGGFRSDVINVMSDLVGQATAQQNLLDAWPHFAEESRLDFAYDVLTLPEPLSAEFAEKLFFHSASSIRCKKEILCALLASAEGRQLRRGFFESILDRLAASSTPATRDDVDLACLEMCELMTDHFGLGT